MRRKQPKGVREMNEMKKKASQAPQARLESFSNWKYKSYMGKKKEPRLVITDT